jgi:DNA-binding NtrC family response regulator
MGNILIVDDSISMRKLVENTFQATGHTVVAISAVHAVTAKSKEEEICSAAI